MNSVFALIVIFVTLSDQSFVTLNDDLDTTIDSATYGNSKDDSGEPLFLTPFIEKNKIAEALNLSKVEDLKNNVIGHSGFLTVNKKFETHLFFWFIRANSENYENIPLLLWLQGGPGASSLFALFCENGPFIIKCESSGELKLEKRQYAWTDEFNVIYLDNPAGTGYSHTKCQQGYSRNQNQIANNLHKALIQFFKMFPRLQRNHFFITGESYAGKYVPSLGHEIQRQNKKSAKNKINLKGLFIGNAFISPRDQLVHGDFLEMIGLIDKNQRQIFNVRQTEVAVLIDNKQWLNATNKFSELFFRTFNKYPTLYFNYTGLTTHYNYINDSLTEDAKYFKKYITQPSTRKKIHVGNTEWGDFRIVQDYLKADMMKSVKRKLEILLEHYNILFYNGQLDVICAYPGMTNFFEQLKWSADKEYKTTERKKWYLKEKLVGYYKKASRLTDVMIRNAGHMVPSDTPLLTLTLLKEFVYFN